MKKLPRRHASYPAFADFESAWRDLAAGLGGREEVAGRSVEGRPIWRFDLGRKEPDAPVVLLTALIHGVEVIGSIACADVLRRIKREHGLRGEDLLSTSRVVVLPMLNPDAAAVNLDRIERGYPAWQRRNHNGVDLNRNFPSVDQSVPRNPFAGSRWKFSPYYRGPGPLSEPESRTVSDVAAAVRPAISIGFHSFGNMLLFPWAFSRTRNPREHQYQRLGTAFARGLDRFPYKIRQAIDLYPTIGDLDDYLDHCHGSLAFTVEVSALDRRLINPLRFVNPFWWMNPTKVGETVSNLSPGVLGLLGHGLGLV